MQRIPSLIISKLQRLHQKMSKSGNNIKKALHRSFRTDEICNVVFHISQLNTPYYRDKYDLLSPSFVPLDSVSQSMYN